MNEIIGRKKGVNTYDLTEMSAEKSEEVMGKIKKFLSDLEKSETHLRESAKQLENLGVEVEDIKKVMEAEISQITYLKNNVNDVLELIMSDIPMGNKIN